MTCPIASPRLQATLALVDRAATRLQEASSARVQVEHKGEVDLVTAVDRELQAMLVAGLNQAFAGERVVAEEEDSHLAPTGPQWVWYVDPLDGTTNFVHGYPFHGISVAAWRDGVPQVAVVACPALGETFVAAAGKGALVRRHDVWQKLHGSRCATLREALLATGFPYDRTAPARLTVACLAYALARARGVRRGGSASLDLCYVAEGRLDGFFELTLKPWDVAAGTLVAREAGMVVTDFVGGGDFLWGQRIAVANPDVHPDLLRLLADAHAAPEEWPLGEPFPGPVPLAREENP